MSELIDRLRMAAHDIANERLFGWGNTCADAADELERKDRELAEAQAKIDRLMLEYCPEEMTEDQMQRWANSQKISPERKP